MSAIISAPFWKKDTASVHSHPGCEQSVPPAEMQCLAVVPSLHFTSVFGAISSNLSKSFCILALSPKRPCHPSLITLVCMHNNPTSSSLTVSSVQTQDGANTGECAAQPAVQTGNHWEQQLPRDVLSCSVHGLGPQLFHHVVFNQGALKQRGRGLWPQNYSYDAAPLRHMAEKVGRWVEGPFPGRPPLFSEQLAAGWVRWPVLFWLLKNCLSQAIFPFEVSGTPWATSLISPSAKFSLMRFIQLFQHGLTLSIQSGQKGSFILLP